MNQRVGRKPPGESGGASSHLSGVLETIAAGLSLVLARPYLVVVPLVIDLVLWLGLHISARSLFDPLRRVMLEQGGENGPLAAEQLAVISERFRVNDMTAWFTPSIFGGLPKDSLLNGILSVLAPPLTRGVERGNMYESWQAGLLAPWDPERWWTVIGTMVAAFAVATVLVVIYRVPIARSVRHSDGIRQHVAMECLLAWTRLIAILLLTAGALAVLIAPALFGTAVLLLMGLNIAGVVSVGLFVFGGLASMYTLFTLDAMFLERIGPLKSVSRSFDVVRANFGSTTRFALASLVLATGSLQVWSVITQNAPGVIIALIGNAVLGTGLTTASMMFFQDRAAALAVSVESRTPRPTRPGWLR
ncbi:MAG TPA: hypothetical protein VGR08_14140 [Thermomicrobiales bacterium]|nr:hypothetical protein [Thermomicrobiales bacterium]